MIDSDTKRLAFATMEDASAFELHLGSTAPVGEVVVELARAPLQTILPIARFVSRMARTFFADKMRRTPTRGSMHGPVGLFVVVELEELPADAIEPLEG